MYIKSNIYNGEFEVPDDVNQLIDLYNKIKNTEHNPGDNWHKIVRFERNKRIWLEKIKSKLEKKVLDKRQKIISEINKRKQKIEGLKKKIEEGFRKEQLAQYYGKFRQDISIFSKMLGMSNLKKTREYNQEVNEFNTFVTEQQKQYEEETKPIVDALHDLYNTLVKQKEREEYAEYKSERLHYIEEREKMRKEYEKQMKEKIQKELEKYKGKIVKVDGKTFYIDEDLGIHQTDEKPEIVIGKVYTVKNGRIVEDNSTIENYVKNQISKQVEHIKFDNKINENLSEQNLDEKMVQNTMRNEIVNTIVGLNPTLSLIKTGLEIAPQVMSTIQKVQKEEQIKEKYLQQKTNWEKVYGEGSFIPYKDWKEFNEKTGGKFAESLDVVKNKEIGKNIYEQFGLDNVVGLDEFTNKLIHSENPSEYVENVAEESEKKAEENTFVIGKTKNWNYKTGETPTKEEIALSMKNPEAYNYIYHVETYQEAKEYLKKLGWRGETLVEKASELSKYKPDIFLMSVGGQIKTHRIEDLFGKKGEYVELQTITSPFTGRKYYIEGSEREKIDLSKLSLPEKISLAVDVENPVKTLYHTGAAIVGTVKILTTGKQNDELSKILEREYEEGDRNNMYLKPTEQLIHVGSYVGLGAGIRAVSGALDVAKLYNLKKAFEYSSVGYGVLATAEVGKQVGKDILMGDVKKGMYTTGEFLWSSALVGIGIKHGFYPKRYEIYKIKGSRSGEPITVGYGVEMSEEIPIINVVQGRVGFGKIKKIDLSKFDEGRYTTFEKNLVEPFFNILKNNDKKFIQTGYDIAKTLYKQDFGKLGELVIHSKNIPDHYKQDVKDVLLDFSKREFFKSKTIEIYGSNIQKQYLGEWQRRDVGDIEISTNDIVGLRKLFVEKFKGKKDVKIGEIEGDTFKIYFGDKKGVEVFEHKYEPSDLYKSGEIAYGFEPKEKLKFVKEKSMNYMDLSEQSVRKFAGGHVIEKVEGKYYVKPVHEGRYKDIIDFIDISRYSVNLKKLKPEQLIDYLIYQPDYLSSVETTPQSKELFVKIEVPSIVNSLSKSSRVLKRFVSVPSVSAPSSRPSVPPTITTPSVPSTSSISIDTHVSIPTHVNLESVSNTPVQPNNSKIVKPKKDSSKPTIIKIDQIANSTILVPRSSNNVVSVPSVSAPTTYDISIPTVHLQDISSPIPTEEMKKKKKLKKKTKKEKTKKKKEKVSKDIFEYVYNPTLVAEIFGIKTKKKKVKKKTWTGIDIRPLI